MSRFFFALWPEARTAAALHEISVALAEISGGKAIPAEKIHLTLAFLGRLEPAALARARELAAEVGGSTFAMTLDGVGAFRNAQVAWAAPAQVPLALRSLQASLAASLRDADFELEERAFAPHVTLARRIGKRVPRAPMRPVEWKVDDFVLAESVTGTGRYEVVERWKLGFPPARE
jgi:2'-5' RNA ligase